MLLAATAIAGTMTACTVPAAGGPCQFLMGAHGNAPTRRDCGVHEFTRDDGITVRVTIACSKR